MNRKFEKLTPIHTCDITEYEPAIDFALSDPDIRNVAISGAFCAGKSSVLETYKKKHKDLKHISISLAHFPSAESKPDSRKTHQEKSTRTILEGKIINQLIHQIPPCRIPQTNFRIKKTISLFKLIIYALSIIALILCTVYNLNYTEWCEYVDGIEQQCAQQVSLSEESTEQQNVQDNNVSQNNFPSNIIISILKFSTYRIWLFICGAIITIILSIFIFLIIRILFNKRILKKLVVKGSEIEIFEETSESYFDKYLNEVLYLLEKTEANLIIFEDIDRFECTGIFERLREINALANLSRKRKKKPLRFFYLLRDDIFNTKDRTKFFDFIIPIVPIADSSNSYNLLISRLVDSDNTLQFSQKFLKGLSLYIDDMRMIKNICNEFGIYYSKLNTIELNADKMLALIAYKNLFPGDFSKLQLKCGYVYTVLSQKNNLIKNEIANLNKQISNKKQQIANANSESLNSIDELDIILQAKQNKLLMSFAGANEKLKKEFDNWKNNEYPRRKKAIENKTAENISKLEQEITNLKNEVNFIQKKSLHDIINRSNDENIFNACYVNELGQENTFSDVKSSIYFDSLKYFIRNGYIDESYSDYLTFYYDNSLSRTDKIFLRSIADQTAKEYEYKLDSPEKIFENLNPTDFEEPEVLNYALIDWMLTTDSVINISQCLETLVQQLKNTENFNFVSSFYINSSASEKFVKLINSHWKEFLNEVIYGSKLTSDILHRYTVDSIYYSDSLSDININNILTHYISNNKNYLNIESPNVKRLISSFSELGVSFAEIDYDCSNKELFKEVYNNCLYDLNFKNITLMLTTQYPDVAQEDILHRNYSVINQHPDSPLANYVSENYGKYLEIILCDNIEYINDYEESALMLLNNSDISTEQKLRYISHLSTTITNILNINEPNLWKNIAEKNIMELSSLNISHYYYIHSLDDQLIQAINNNQSELNVSDLFRNLPNEHKEKLFNDLATCNDLKTEIYKNILSRMPFKFSQYNKYNISNDKFDVLIKNRIIDMDKDSLNYVRQHYKSHLGLFISRNVDKYISTIKQGEFDLDEALEVAKYTNVSNQKKIEVLSLTDEKISIVEKNFPDEISAYILEHNYDKNDKNYLMIHFSKYGRRTQDMIERICCSILNNDNSDEPIDPDLISRILRKPRK